MFVTFDNGNKVVDEFLDLLKDLKIDPPLYSNIENELLSFFQLLDLVKNPKSIPECDKETIEREALGIADFCSKVLELKKNINIDFNKIVPHLKLISKESKFQSSIGQNSKKSICDDTVRKLTELYLSCVLFHLDSDTHLDHPTFSKGDNPDLISQITTENNEVVKLGFAVKSISTKNPQTIYERIKDGCDQINSNACDLDHGILFINVQNTLDHTTFYKTQYSDLEAAKKSLTDSILQLVPIGLDHQLDEIKGLKVINPVIFMGQTVVFLPTAFSERTLTSLKVLVSTNIFKNESTDSFGENIAKIINDGIMIINPH